MLLLKCVIFFLTLVSFYCFQDKDKKDNGDIALTDILDKDKFRIILFYSSWLESCNESIEIFDELKIDFREQNDITIGKIDIYSNRKIASRFKIDDYCLAKFFVKGSVVAERVDTKISLDNLRSFITRKSKTVLNNSVFTSTVIELTVENFNRIVANPDKTVLVLFCTQYSKKCDKLRDVIHTVGAAIKRDKECVLAQIDAHKHYDISREQAVGVYPTFKFYPKTNKDGETYLPGKYEENWSERNISKFMHAHCGIHGGSGEPVDLSHGRINIFDAQANRFIREHSKRQEIFEKTFELAENTAAYRKPLADIYIKIMESVKTEGDSWVTDEINRVNKMLLKDMLHKDRDELQKKRNILKQFHYERHDEL